jgi:hypothetical protein
MASNGPVFRYGACIAEHNKREAEKDELIIEPPKKKQAVTEEGDAHYLIYRMPFCKLTNAFEFCSEKNLDRLELHRQRKEIKKLLPNLRVKLLIKPESHRLEKNYFYLICQFDQREYEVCSKIKYATFESAKIALDTITALSDIEHDIVHITF